VTVGAGGLPFDRARIGHDHGSWGRWPDVADLPGLPARSCRWNLSR